MGDVYDDLPPTPPDLHLPAARPQSHAARPAAAAASSSSNARDAAGPAAAALRSIARVAFMGRGGGAPRSTEQVPPEEVVVAVREMRAERDELRRRDAGLRGQLEAARDRLGVLEPVAELGNAVAEAVAVLEGLMGPSPLADPNSGDAAAAAAAANHAARLAVGRSGVGCGVRVGCEGAGAGAGVVCGCSRVGWGMQLRVGVWWELWWGLLLAGRCVDMCSYMCGRVRTRTTPALPRGCDDP